MIFEYSNEQLNDLKTKDERLKAVIEKIGRIKRESYPDLFSALIKTISGQQISTKAAATVWQRMKDNLGDVTPENYSKYTIEEIQKCSLSFRKAEYIKKAAESFVNGIDINSLLLLPNEEFIKEMIKLPGVGRWTAEMLLLFTL